MRVAYFTPLNPVKSGISDFSEELIPYLGKKLEVEIFTIRGITTNKEITEHFVVRDINEYDNESIRKSFDLAVFHIGNSYECHHEIIEMYKKYGGIMELHDVSLHHYLAEETIVQKQYEKYVDIMTYCHGEKGKIVAEQFIRGECPAPWEGRSLEFTVCKHLIDLAQGVIVHSDLAKQMVLGIRPDARVINIPLHTSDIVDNFDEMKLKAKKKLGISEEQIVFGAFGHATEHKRIPQILKALSIYKSKNTKFHFYIVGQVSGMHIDQIIHSLSLDGFVTVTGFTSLDDFKLYMQACDIAFNLRYPTQGESSASLHRLLGMGKPILVTDIGSFREYIDGVVCKIPYDDYEIDAIVNNLLYLTKDSKRLKKICQSAVEYAKINFSLSGNVERYQHFFENIRDNSFFEDYIDCIVTRLMKFRLNKEEYINHYAENVDWL